MVEIFAQRIEGGALESDPDYHFTVKYSASFDPGELSHTFHEFVRLREDDSGAPFGGGDDFLTAEQPSGNTFKPNTLPSRADTRPGHQGMTVVDRDVSFEMPRGVADTETGHEEIYAQIWLRSDDNLGNGAAVGSDSGVATTGSGDFNP